MDNVGRTTHVLLAPSDLIHRELFDPDGENIGYVRDLLIDEADWMVRFVHATALSRIRLYSSEVAILERFPGGVCGYPC